MVRALSHLGKLIGVREIIYFFVPAFPEVELEWMVPFAWRRSPLFMYLPCMVPYATFARRYR
jgi:hypothetical protein